MVTGRTPLLGAGIRVRPLHQGAEATGAPMPEMIELSQERRAKLVSAVEGSARLPEAAKERILATLAKTQVPAKLVDRIEARMGG